MTAAGHRERLVTQAAMLRGSHLQTTGIRKCDKGIHTPLPTVSPTNAQVRKPQPTRQPEKPTCTIKDPGNTWGLVLPEGFRY